MEKAWKALLTSEESSSETESYEEEPEETVSEEEDSEDLEDKEEEDTADNEDDEKWCKNYVNELIINLINLSLHGFNENSDLLQHQDIVNWGWN